MIETPLALGCSGAAWRTEEHPAKHHSRAWCPLAFWVSSALCSEYRWTPLPSAWPSALRRSCSRESSCAGRAFLLSGMPSYIRRKDTWRASDLCGCRCAPSGIGLRRTSCGIWHRCIAWQGHELIRVSSSWSGSWISCRSHGTCTRKVSSSSVFLVSQVLINY